MDDKAVDLSLWDVRGIDYDPSWLHDAQVALVCFSINIGSTDAKGKHLERVSGLHHPAPFQTQNNPSWWWGTRDRRRPAELTVRHEQWVREVSRNCPAAAILLVGLKSDIRWQAKTVEKLRRHGKALVTPEQGGQLRDSIGALRYLECSARTGEGVMEVLEEAARAALQVRSEDHTKRGHRRPLSRIGKFLGLGNRENDSQAGWQ